MLGPARRGDRRLSLGGAESSVRSAYSYPFTIAYDAQTRDPVANVPMV